MAERWRCQLCDREEIFSIKRPFGWVCPCGSGLLEQRPLEPEKKNPQEMRDAMLARLLGVVREISQRLHKFSSDDIFDVLPQELVDGPDGAFVRVTLGAALRIGRKRGFCEPTHEFVISRRKSRARAENRVWKSLMLLPARVRPPKPEEEDVE